MPLGNPQSGISFGPEFQSAALPWVTSSIALSASSGPTVFDFPYVTRFITLINQGPSSLSMGFTQNGMSRNNKVTLASGQQQTFEWRVKRIFLQGEGGTPSYSLAVGLTTIAARNMPLLSGTLEDGTSGWSGVG